MVAFCGFGSEAWGETWGREAEGSFSMLIVGRAAAAPEKTRAVTNWRRSKGMGVPRETVRRGLWHLRSVKVASQQTADQTFYYLIGRIKIVYLIEIGKIQTCSRFRTVVVADTIFLYFREFGVGCCGDRFRFDRNRKWWLGQEFRFSGGSVPQDKQQVRFTTILTSLQQTGRVSVDALSAQLDVSVVTIRRDLDALEQKGLLRRTHGGAVSTDPLFYEPFRHDRSFLAQVQRAADEKRRIGRAAAALITAGETIALTPGTTTTEVIRRLPINYNITVVTNTVNVAMELSKRKDVYVFVTGGHLHGEWFSLVGSAALRSLDNMLINTMFIGADGLDAGWGASCFNADEAELNSTMMKLARRRVAVVDSGKLGRVANWRICKPEELHFLVTDTAATDEMVAPFQKLGVKVMRV